VVTALASKEAQNEGEATPVYMNRRTILANRIEVQIFSVAIDIINGISTNRPPISCRIDLGSRTLIDLKFLNDETLVILSNNQGEPMNSFFIQQA
jgi:hypothetical protein